MKFEMPDGILKEKHGTAEYRLHVAFVDYLRGNKRIGNKLYPITRPFPDLFDGYGKQKWTHCAQGRDKTEGFFLNQMGLRAGVLDLFFWYPRIFFMDAKDWGRDYSLEQKNFCLHMENIGVKTFKFYTAAEGRDILIKQGLRCDNMLVNEPKASKEDQQLAYLETLRPIE